MTKAQKSSGNVFADLGISNSSSHFLKAGLVSRLSAVIQDKKLTQNQVAEITGISQPDISKVLRGQFREMSAERIIRAINSLGMDVDIQVSSHEGKPVGEKIHMQAEMA